MSEKAYEISINKKITNIKNRIGLKENNENYGLALKSIMDAYYRDWKYNQIVGYLCFNIKHNSIDGHLWWICQKRIPLVFDKKIYKYRICYPSWDFHLNKNMTNNEICEAILIKIGNDSTNFLNKYFVDTNVIKQLGKYINWHDFIE